MTTKGSHYIINYLDTQAQLNLRAIALGTLSTVIDPKHTGLSQVFESLNSKSLSPVPTDFARSLDCPAQVVFLATCF